MKTFTFSVTRNSFNNDKKKSTERNITLWIEQIASRDGCEIIPFLIQQHLSFSVCQILITIHIQKGDITHWLTKAALFHFGGSQDIHDGFIVFILVQKDLITLSWILFMSVVCAASAEKCLPS